MISANQLTVDGISTDSFTFPVYVTKNAGFVYAKKKNIITETDYGTGGNKTSVRSWPTIEKSYQLYCPTASLIEMRRIKSWAKDNGKLISSDEPDVFYEILDVSIDNTRIHDISGYLIDITFTTQPFGYEHVQDIKTYNNGDIFINTTNAPMFPQIKIYGNSNEKTTLKIGEQLIGLKEIKNSITIESKPLEQNVYDHGGLEKNGVMKGDFIEIKEGSQNKVVLGEGIEKIEMLERWAWL